MTDDSGDAPETVPSRVPWYQGHLRAYGWMTLVCAAIAGADYVLLASGLGHVNSRRWFEYLLCLAFVLQVILLAWATGKVLRTTPGRWVFFIWCLILINLLLQALNTEAAETMKYAFLAGESGLLCIWSFLGQPRWQTRLTLAIVLFPGLAALTMGTVFFQWYYSTGWHLIVTLYGIVVLAVSGVGCFLGYRIGKYDPQSSLSSLSMQFRLMDMLLWMLALMPALLILKSLSWLRLFYLSWRDTGLAAIISSALALTTILTLQSVLGKTSWQRVLLCVIVIPAFIGYTFWTGAERLASWLGSWGGRGYEQVMSLFIRTGSAWVPWMILLNAFLAALLLCFRADGQRLVRRRRG